MEALVQRHRTVLAAFVVVLASVVGCGGGGPTMSPDAATAMIVGDHPPTGCTAPTCGSAFTSVDCVCAPSLFGAMYPTTVTACSQISTGRARTPARDYCSAGAAGQAPNLSCMTTLPVRGTPTMVTLYGVVDIFANGGDSSAITIDVFEEGAGGALGTMRGTATSSITGVATGCGETEVVYDTNGQPTTTMRNLGFFSIPNIPTETPLIIRTQGDPGLWSPLYTYNFAILNSDVAAIPSSFMCSGAPTGMGYFYRARVLSRNDYGAIPLTAGLASGIQGGHGALAGEVHDCSDVRLQYAQVGMTGNPASRVYFNDIADNPLPEVSRTQGTSLLGLYAGLDIVPGPVDVAAIGYVNGQSVSLGWYHARVFADAVTVVSLRGIRSWQH
jgi:hypothetical protein